MMLNFIAGGMMGDFIHSLYAVKHLCAKSNEKGNLIIAEGHGDVWRFDLQRTYNDLYELIEAQDYIEKFGIMPPGFSDEAVNLTDWRKTLVHTPAGYVKCWSEVLSECYNFSIPEEYKWLNATVPDPTTHDKILIHRSVHRHNGAFPWKSILDRNHDKEILFLTSNQAEWNGFQFKHRNIRPHIVSTITEMANAIAACKVFIGNQSAPFSLACALDVPRLVELDADPSKFYMDEIKYSNNISWYLNGSCKYYTNQMLGIVQ